MIHGLWMRRTFRSKESGSICTLAVDSDGNTQYFLLTAKRDATAAERFFRQALAATHTQTPRVINVDQNAAYPKAEKTLKASARIDSTVTFHICKIGLKAIAFL